MSSAVSSPNCFDRFFAHPKVKIAYHVLEKVSLIALAVLAAYTCPKLFFPFFGGGIVVGTCLFWNKRISWPCTEQISCHRHGSTCEQEHAAGGCSQGFMEQLSGARLPPPLGLGVNIAITVGHIGHHSSIFVPIIGLNAGVWIGSILGDVLPGLIDQCLTGGAVETEESYSHSS